MCNGSSCLNIVLMNLSMCVLRAQALSQKKKNSSGLQNVVWIRKNVCTYLTSRYLKVCLTNWDKIGDSLSNINMVAYEVNPSLQNLE